jgi:hypothetical protein
MTTGVRSGVHPEGFSSGDITGTTLKGVKRVHPEGFSLKGSVLVTSLEPP